jgi:RNA polymerase sigma-70 factor (ECF subfamily)
LRINKRNEAYLQAAAACHQQTERPVLHRIIEAETIHQLYRALDTLPAKCGRVLKMYYLEEKNLREIADEMNISLSTAKSQEIRAILLLRKKLPWSGFLFSLCIGCLCGSV